MTLILGAMQSSKFFQSLPVCSSLQMYSLRRIWSVLLTIARGRPLRKIYACFNAGFLVILLISTYVAIQCWRTQWSSWPTQRLHTNVARDCACIDRDTGISYDFCYGLPANRSIRGRRFSCEWLPMLKSLKLLDYAGRFIDLENSAVSFQNVVFVLAASQNHFHLALAAIANIQKNFPKTQRLVFYDLGLYSDSSNAIRRLCNVEYRKFRFSDYPEWVDRLHEFRWKPIIIAVSFLWSCDMKVSLPYHLHVVSVSGSLERIPYDLVFGRQYSNDNERFIRDLYFIQSFYECHIGWPHRQVSLPASQRDWP